MTTAIHTSPSAHSKVPGVALGVSLALSAGAIALSVVAITTDDVGGSGGSGTSVATASAIIVWIFASDSSPNISNEP